MRHNPASEPAGMDACLALLSEAFRADGLKLDTDKAKAIVAGFDPSVADAFFTAGVLHHLRAYETRLRAKPMTEAERARLAASTKRIRADRAECKRLGISPEDLVGHRLKNALEGHRENVEKAAKFDKVVEMLDTWMVGGVRLGDCTKEKLLAEAARSKANAADFTKLATAYTKLASHMSDGETVRANTKRGAVLEILLALKPN